MMIHNFQFLNDPNYSFLKDRMQSSAFSLSFLSESFGKNEWADWKQTAREFLGERLFYSPNVVPLDPEITEEEDFGTYIRKKLYFSSAPGYRVPAYLLVPKNLRQPAPGIVYMHDHGGMLYWGKEKVVEHKRAHEVLGQFIDKCYGGKPPASELARRGYVTLVTDDLFFGERRLDLEQIDPFKERLREHHFESPEYVARYNELSMQVVEPEVSKAIYYAGWTCAGIRLHDDRASARLLRSLPEVDASRIGSIGLSMGGHRAGLLAAMDDNITCAAVVCWMARYQEMVEHKISNIHWTWAVPGIHGALDYPDVVSLSAPKPLMLLHGTQDHLFPYETGQKAIAKVKEVFEKAGATASLTCKYYDNDHEFNLGMQQDAYEWLDRQLQG